MTKKKKNRRHAISGKPGNETNRRTPQGIYKSFFFNNKKLSLRWPYSTRSIPIFAGDSIEYCNFIRVFKNVENVIERESARLYYLLQCRSGHEVKNDYVKGQAFQASSEYIVRCQGGARR